MRRFLLLLLLPGLVFLSSCRTERVAAAGSKKTIVVTYAIMGSLVRELAGDDFTVRVIIPNGLDVHEWEPSAKDIESILKASLIVENGLGLESGLSKTLAKARSAGVNIFTASDHVAVRRVGEGEGIPGTDADQRAGAQDPHLWLDPLAMRSMANALAGLIASRFPVDLSGKADALSARLTALEAAIRARADSLPLERRRLVTGHESLGYFARAFGFRLVGAIVPSLTTQAEVSASDMAGLKALISESGVNVIFTETGTPPKVARALAVDAGVRAVEIHTHLLPADGSYFTFLTELSDTIIGSLK